MWIDSAAQTRAATVQTEKEELVEGHAREC